MRLVNTDDIKTGDILSDDVYAPNGRFLLSKGSVIAERDIRILSIWMVPAVKVAGIDQNEAAGRIVGQADPGVVKRAETAMSRRFELAELSHPAMAELFRLCVSRTVEQFRNPLGGGDEEFTNASLNYSEEFGSNTPGAEPELPPLDKLVGDQAMLASLPDVYYRIMEAIQSPNSTANHMAEMVGRDTSMASRLLKLVNSPFYGFPSQVETISRAIVLIGSNELSMLALGISLLSAFQHVPDNVINMRMFWKHSIAVGVFARLLAALRPGLSEERFFIAGLLHEIGLLVMLLGIPKPVAKSLVLAGNTPLPLYEAEDVIIGYDHAQAGGRLLSEWRLPPALSDMIRHHHRPQDADNRLEAAILHVADILAPAVGYGYARPTFVPPLADGIWEELDYSPSVLSSILKQSDRQIGEIFNALLSRGR